MGAAMTAERRPFAASLRTRLRAAFLTAVPLSRVRALQVIVHVMVILDVLTFSRDVLAHAGNAAFYRPVALARLLHLPAVTPGLAAMLLAVILLGSAVVIAGGRLDGMLKRVLRGRRDSRRASARAVRVTGVVVAVAYWVWMLYSNSYGYVAHDHMALLVAVAVLPTVRLPLSDARAGAEAPVGPAADAATEPESEAGGWALRCVQIAVVSTYFFSIIPKILYTGSLAAWGNSAILTWASIRRGSPIAHWLVENAPWVFVPAQWAGLAIEALSPVVLFLRGKALYVSIALYLGFHLSTLLLLGIHFLPTVVCWAAFLPLERISIPRRSSNIPRRGVRETS